MTEKNVCKICFERWLTEPLRTGQPAKTMTGEELMNCEFAFDTEKELIAHLQEEHKIKVMHPRERKL